MKLERITALKLRTLACACALFGVAIAASLQPAGSDAANRRCSPVVTAVGPGFTKAFVLILTGRVDCEKSREVIFKALSTSPYEEKQIKGWDCRSTDRGGSGVYGARCATQGERDEELIRSTIPRRCPACRKIRR